MTVLHIASVYESGCDTPVVEIPLTGGSSCKPTHLVSCD